MAYKILVSPRAQQEIENAIEYYIIYGNDLPIKFVASLKSSYNTLGNSPHFRVVYKNIRSLKIRKFPYSLYFTVNEYSKTVRILACFHNKRNPNKRPSGIE